MTSIPLVCSFWFMLTAYIVHIMDESLLGGNFCREGPPALVARVFLAQVFLVQHWLPAHYERASIVLYDRLGQPLLFLPLAWAIERLFNAIWHVWWTVHFQEYSPGLLTSLLI